MLEFLWNKCTWETPPPPPDNRQQSGLLLSIIFDNVPNLHTVDILAIGKPWSESSQDWCRAMHLQDMWHLNHLLGSLHLHKDAHIGNGEWGDFREGSFHYSCWEVLTGVVVDGVGGNCPIFFIFRFSFFDASLAIATSDWRTILLLREHTPPNTPVFDFPKAEVLGDESFYFWKWQTWWILGGKCSVTFSQENEHNNDIHFLLQGPRPWNWCFHPGKPNASSTSTPSWKGSRRVLEGILKGFFGWQVQGPFETPSKTLQRPLQRPFRNPSKALLGSGGSVAGMKVLRA